MKQIKTIIAAICRTLLGVVFIFSGVVKAIDPLGTVYKIEDYLKAFGGFFSDLLPLAEVAAWALIITELLLGVCMVMNVRTKWTSWIALAFYCVMTPLTLYIALTNPVSDCGCFGDAVVLTNWQTFWKNAVLIVLAIALVALRKHVRQLWSGWMELVIVATSLAAVLSFMAWTIQHLPVIDFRPYKIGNHLPTLMEYPEDAEADVYEFSFVYEKDGVEERFTLENYPKGDSTWTFVRQESKLIQKGYEPPIHDFEVLNADYEDLTWDILESEEPVTLVVIYDLEKADKKQMAKVEALLGDGDKGYILTGSGTDEIISFSLEYPTLSDCICTCDPVTLKTIVRANPGVIVVQNGVVIDKYNIRNRE
ncbi:MAG: DoxX family protein [Paludibacteraceae bacterium]|nr:DoxX family protein [Paludibacteraceae bacterium]